jgi:hypothetical protein
MPKINPKADLTPEKIFRQFHHLNILVAGDLILDQYIWGKVERISPEAPVPIVAVSHRENRLGGAGNVAANLTALECSVTWPESVRTIRPALNCRPCARLKTFRRSSKSCRIATRRANRG